MTVIKRQGVKRLLISQDPDFRYSVTDRGIDWVTDRYVLARRDLFTREPATRLTLKTTIVRGVLDKARRSPLLDGRVSAGQTVKGVDGRPVILLAARTLNVAVNIDAWRGWSLTGLTPRLNGIGQLMWFGDVRGKQALYGLIQPVLLGGWS